MSKDKKSQGTPAVVAKDGRKTTYKCGKKHSGAIPEDKKNTNQGVENVTES